jgi:D-glycero-D-manno-heptose 1,7-bisphosphate phosphatase
MSGDTRPRAIFFDRDGTLLVEMGYLNHPSMVRPYSFAPEALKTVRREGFLLIVVTNQSGVARGYITESDLGAIHARMQNLFDRTGVELDAIYYCPHHPRGTVEAYRRACSCRKPAPGLGWAAAERFGIDLAGSYMIGDKETDVLFGKNLGVTPCLVRTGYGSYAERIMETGDGDAVRVFDHVLAAVEWITSGSLSD